MSRICRICMSFNEPMVSLFRDRRNLDLFQKLGDIDISQDEVNNMEALICNKCQLHLLDFATIRHKIQTVDQLSFQPLREKLKKSNQSKSGPSLGHVIAPKAEMAHSSNKNVGLISDFDDDPLLILQSEHENQGKSEENQDPASSDESMQERCAAPNLKAKRKTASKLTKPKAEVSNRFKCRQCDKSYKEKRYLQHHVEADHEGIRYPCEICGHELKKKRELSMHMRRHHLKDVKTIQLSRKKMKKFTNPMFEAINDDENDPDVVDSSKKDPILISDDDNEDSIIHQVKLENPIPTFSRDEYKKKSSDTFQHQAKDPEVASSLRFKCSQCDKSYSESKSLKQHFEAIHQGLRHPCEICGEEFTQKNNLTRHMKRHHTEIKPKEENQNSFD